MEKILKKSEVKPELVSVEIKITQETFDHLTAYIQHKGYEIDEGLRIILGAGLGYLLAHSLDEGNETNSSEDNNKERLIQRLIRTEARLASIRYKMFELQQANQNWTLSSGAIYTENAGLRALAKRRTQEVTDLQQKTKEKDILIEQLQGRSEISLSQIFDLSDLPKWKRALLRWMKLQP